MHHAFKTFVVVILIAITLPLNAQKNIESQQLLWAGYSLKVQINETYLLRQELEERTYWFPWRQHQFISRTMLDRKLNNGWSTALGFVYLQQAQPQDPEVKDFKNSLELRPVAELAYTHDIISKVTLGHRYWTEFRFFEQSNGDYDFGTIRARYKIELRYAPISQLTFKAFEELHVNIGNKVAQNIFDQNRIGISAQYMFLENLGFELGYFNWYQQRSTGVDFYDRNIVRFTVHHKLKLKN